ncbi:glycoside hydrolase [Exidia glandulosa HHB12029]|uniref:Glycoside hydrolase n=1 Tax=Exidia glandulosa HHB12029 TaxID=1314781 RepID=A0A165NY66_EXIGL|nr:glycoside hydrolase [Exidia glandulosa HHB12029]
MNYPAAQQQTVLDLLFSPTKGAGMTIYRIRIGSGGQGDSILPTSPGSPTSTPKYVWDGNDKGQVWVAQKAMTYGVKTFYADAWSAPGFMKTNGVETNGGLLCGVSGASCASGDWRQAYANMIVQYIKYYQQSNVTITHVGFLNEPEYSPTYSSMSSSGTQAADFIKVLYPTIQAAGLSTQITCCDSEGWNNQITMTAQLKSAGVESMLGVITSHAYSSQVGATINTTRPVWQTEYADLSGALLPNNWYSNGGTGEGMTWAGYIYNGVVNSNLSAYLYWIGAEPGNTNSALVLTSGTTTTASKRLWAFAQWGRYVRPGAVRLGTTGSTSTVKFSAFRNTDGSFSVQVLNTGASAASVNVAGIPGATSVEAWVSSQSVDIGTMTTTLSNGVASGSVPAHAMVTFVFSTDGTVPPPSSSSSSSSSSASTTTTTSVPTTTTTTATSTPTECVSQKWGQCGGQGWTGCTLCAAGSTCQAQNQCESNGNRSLLRIGGSHIPGTTRLFAMSVRGITSSRCHVLLQNPIFARSLLDS